MASPWIAAAVIFGDGSTPVLVTELIFFPLAVAMLFLYDALFTMRRGRRNGQTLGKQMVGIRVVSDHAPRVGVGTALLRDFVCKGLLGFVTGGLFNIISVLWVLPKRENRALHDPMAGTHVVRA